MPRRAGRHRPLRRLELRSSRSSSRPAPICLLASLVGPHRRAARRPVRRRRHRRAAVRARQPARAVHLHLRAPGRAGRRGPGGAGRLDPGQPAAGARAGVPRRRAQARHPAARLGAGAHHRGPDAAVGDRVGDPVARALRARPGVRARGDVLGDRLRRSCSALFALSLPFSLRRDARSDAGEPAGHEHPALADVRWPSRCSPPRGVLAAFVSDWFVHRARADHGLGRRSPRRSPAWSWSPSPATPSRTSSASSSPPPATPSTRSRSCSTARSRSPWCSRRCW